MRTRNTTLTTDQKALAVNLDKYKYGSIVEIGAGQEVARRFFQVALPKVPQNPPGLQNGRRAHAELRQPHSDQDRNQLGISRRLAAHPDVVDTRKWTAPASQALSDEVARLLTHYQSVPVG